MRIQVTGEGASARVLREYLASLGYQLVDRAAAYVVRVEEGGDGNIVLEGAVGALAHEARLAVEELAGARVEWRASSQGSGRELRVVGTAGAADAVERGVLRALLRVTGHGERKSWMDRIRRRVK